MKPFVFALTATLLTSAPALAGSASLKHLTLAQDLFTYGLQQQDPVMVLSAAKIAAALYVKDVTREVETRASAAPATAPDTDPADGAEPAIVTATQMFQTAYQLAEGDETLTMMIEDAEAEGSRGQMGGATRTLNRLQSGFVDVVRVQYKGGELAELAILGGNGANLDLRVTDDRGKTICAEQGASDKLYCAWTPAADGVFFAEVENLSSKRNSYYVLTN